jgi:hypothetical protein
LTNKRRYLWQIDEKSNGQKQPGIFLLVVQKLAQDALIVMLKDSQKEWPGEMAIPRTTPSK